APQALCIEHDFDIDTAAEAWGWSAREARRATAVADLQDGLYYLSRFRAVLCIIQPQDFAQSLRAGGAVGEHQVVQGEMRYQPPMKIVAIDGAVRGRRWGNTLGRDGGSALHQR